MPTLQEILQDPNFVNANPATKQAIFDRWAPQDPNYSGANGATQQAIRQRFGIGRSAPAVQPEPPKEEESGFLRQVADVPLGLAKGAVSGVRMVADAFGANSPVSQTIKGAEDYLAGLMSAESRKDSQEIARIMQDAEDKGMGEQVKAALQAFMTAPVDLLAQGLGTAAPVVLSTLGAKVLGAGALATKGIGLGLGAGMGAGVTKGTIYEETKKALQETGMPEEQAEARAQLAQSYGGENLDMILAGTALGGLASTTGIEKALAGPLARGILARAGAQEGAEQAAQQGLARRVATGALTESVPEVLQAGQEQLAANIALQREGFDVDTMRGVVGAAALEGLVGAGLGAGVGAIPSGTTAQQPPAPPREEPLPETPEAPIPPVAPAEPEAGVSTFTPERAFTVDDIDAAGVDLPRGFIPFARRNILGKTRSQLQAEVEANPELIEGEAPSARLIRTLLQPQPAADQSGVGVPVQQPAGGAAGVAAPQLGAVDGTGTIAQPPVVPQAPVTPTVTEIPRGTTTPQAIEAEAQGPQATPGEVILQNRNRATPASITQMQDIAAKPDYGRMGFSRDFANGAPVVFGGSIPETQLGVEETAIATDGQRIPVRYAVMNANEVLASNRADGGVNQEYATATDRTRAIAGNGRIAGIQAAHQRGTTGDYVRDLKADARLHGIDPGVIDSVQNPVLVRIMPEQFVTPDIGDVSNIATGLELSPTEKARNDQRRVDLGALQFAEDGSITPNTVIQFVRGMPKTEQGGLINPDGRPSSQAYDRLRNAIFARAYNDDQLIELYAQTEDADARNVLSALAQVAGKMARLEGAGDFDIRNIVTDAAKIAVNARRSGIAISRVAQQADIAADPDVQAILDMLAVNSRSVPKMAGPLGTLADRAYEEFTKPAEDFFGEVPKRTREELVGQLRTENEQARQQAVEEQDRRRATQEDDVRQAPEPTGAQAAPATPGEELALTPPSAEAQAEADRRAEEAAKAEEEAAKEAEKAAEAERKERERREIEQRSAGAAEDFRLGQTAEENLTGQGDIFDTPVQISPEQQKQDALNVFERALTAVVPRMRARTGNRSVNINPRALTGPRRKALVELAGEAVDLGMPASILSNVRAAGATGMNSTAAINSENGWLLLGKDWNTESKETKRFALIHELGHTTDYGPSGMGKISKTDQWKKSHEELKAWYQSAPSGHPLHYPFSKSFAGRINDVRLESYAQAFALYFNSPVDLQSNAPTAFAKIQSIIEGIQNESRATSRAGPSAPSGATVDVQPSRAQEGAEVQPRAREVGTGVGRAERGQDRGLGEVDQGPDPDVVLDMMESPNIEREAETLEQKAARENIFGGAVLSSWDTPTDTKLFGMDRDHIIYKLQNKQIDTKRVLDAIRKEVGQIATKWDAYLQETLYHGRTAKRTQDYLKDELEKQVEVMQKYGLTKEEVGTYLHNRHAPEANAMIAERNPKFEDGGSGIETQKAIDYMNNLEPQKRKQLEEVAKLIDKSVENMQNELVRDGLESPDTIQTWREMFQYYIPLARVDADFDTTKSMSQGAGYSTSGDTTKSRVGSNKAVNAGEILANLAMQRERAIVRGEKNKVSNALYGLALQNPNPGFWLALDPTTDPVWKVGREVETLKDSLKSLEEILASGNVSKSEEAFYEMEMDLVKRLIRRKQKEASKSIAQARDDLQSMGLDPDLVDQIMKPLMQARYDKTRNEVVYEPRSPIRSEGVLATRFNGEEKYVLFNTNDPRAKRMVESLKNMDADQLGTAMNIMSKITRWFAAVNTQYNPVFGAYNFLRDVQTGLIQVNDTPIADKKREIVKGTMPAIKAIYQSTRKRRKGEKVDTEWANLWEEFQKEGGQTGFRDVFSQSDERATAIQRMIDPSSWSESPLGKVFSANGTLKMPIEQARKVGAPIFDWLSDYNDTMENAIRLSAYKAAKNKFIGEGMDATEAKQRAAAVAKDLTVNFNRKGQIANQAGALYAFFNASVQGTTRMFQLLNSPVGRKIAAGAFLLGSMQAVLLAAAGFDDEEPPDFVKQRNYIIPTGDGKYLAFPMPLGFNVLPNTTRVITEWALSGFEDTPRRVLEITSAMLDMFNPIGNAGWSFQSIAPTTFDPAVALFENRDWTGKQISRKDIDRLDPTPGYTRSKDNASWLSENIAQFLNFASGGDESRPGLISPTADDLDYLIGQVTGGVGREALKVMKTAQAAATGEELPSFNVPLFGRFYGNVTGLAPISNAFYRNMTELNIHKRAIENLRKEKGDVQAYLTDNPEARMAQIAGTQYREIQKLRKTRRELLEKGEDERAKKLEEQIKTRMKRFNERFEKLGD